MASLSRSEPSPPCPSPCGRPSPPRSSRSRRQRRRYAAGPPLSSSARRHPLTTHLQQQRELAWIAEETIDICQELKHGLEDCYALLAPIDPGSTLVMSTPRNERVKGTITRVGTRIVKGVRDAPKLNLEDAATDSRRTCRPSIYNSARFLLRPSPCRRHTPSTSTPSTSSTRTSTSP